MAIMSNKIDSYKSKRVDVLITPEVGDVGPMDFLRKNDACRQV
jgi:hypothetical protein